MFSEASIKASNPLSAPFCQVLVPSNGTGSNTIFALSYFANFSWIPPNILGELIS